MKVTPPTEKVVSVSAAAGVPEPVSLVKTLPVRVVSSATVATLSIICGLFDKIKRTAVDVRLPQT